MDKNLDRKTEVNDEIDLLDYLNVLVKRRRMIVRNCFLAAIAMALISLILPATYTATTTLLPPDEQQSSGLRSLLADSPAAFFDIPGMGGTTSEIFVEILKSRSVVERVLEREYEYENETQPLYEILGEETAQKAMPALRERSRITSNEQGMIDIAVELDTPELAAAVANAYADALDKVNQQKSLSRAKNSRLYIEEQRRQTEADLDSASKALAEFQEKFKAVNIEEQTKVAIERAAEVKGAIMAKEVELRVAMQTMRHNNPVVQRLQAEIDELNKQFDHLQFGNAVPFEEQRDYFIPFSDVPEVAHRYADLIREVKVQETVWQLLNQQYYSAKIQEARDTPTVQVLDEAVPPEKRTSPKRTFLVIVATFLTFCFSVFGAFVMEYAERVKEHEEQYEKLRGIKNELAADFRLLREKMKHYASKLRRG